MKVLVTILCVFVATPVFANNVFLRLSLGYQQQRSDNLTQSSTNISGASALPIHHKNISTLQPMLDMAMGYRWQWQQQTLSSEIAFDQTHQDITINPLLASSSLPANSLHSHWDLSNLFLNTRWNYFFTPHLSSDVLFGLGYARIETNSQFYFAAPPLPAQSTASPPSYKLAMQGGLGLSYHFNQHWQLGADVIYRAYGDIPLGNFYSNPPVSTGSNFEIPHYHSYSVLLNILYHFNKLRAIV